MGLAERKAGWEPPQTDAILNSHHARANVRMPRNQKKNYSAGPIWDEEVKRWLAEVVYPDDLGSNEPEYRWNRLP